MGATKTSAMGLSNATFLIEKLGQECGEVQFLRELTQNAIEAIQRTGRADGEIRWDYDDVLYASEGVLKLCITDNGDGMSGAQMERYLNNLSSSGSRQGFDANFGMGAKVAAATRNPHGLVYLSWRVGAGACVHLWKDVETGVYGLRQYEFGDGTYGNVSDVPDEHMPDVVRRAGSGTRVVLLGRGATDNTTLPPSRVSCKSEWIQKELNRRYFRFPSGIKVTARTHINGGDGKGLSESAYLRVVDGMGSFLDRAKVVGGTVPLEGAVAHWWILPERAELPEKYGRAYETTGHIASLYKNELYGLVIGRAATSRLQQFGVTFGAQRVVIYVEPDAGPDLSTNTARTFLLLAGQDLPWSDWAAQFRQKMPEPLAQLVDEYGARAAGDDHSKQIRERLKPLLALFRVRRYQPDSDGKVTMDPATCSTGGQALESGDERGQGSSGSGTRGGRRGGTYGNYKRPEGPAARELRSDAFPKPVWVSLKNGTRSEEDLADRAARYVEDTNTLLINEDFRGFTDLIGRFASDHGDTPGAWATCTAAAKGWFEQQLTETVLGIQALRNSPEWGSDQVRLALSEEALTAAVMARYHVYLAMKREIATKLGSVMNAA